MLLLLPREIALMGHFCPIVLFALPQVALFLPPYVE